MVGLPSLWLAVLLSAVIVFIASSIIHVALRYHLKDQGALPGEEAIAEAMHKAGVQPGNYRFPYAADQAEMKSEAMQEKWKRGPVGFAQIVPSGLPAMGKNLVMWFVYTIVVGIFVAYLTGRTQAPGAEYLPVFRVAGAAAFLAYAGAEPIASIWYGRNWRTTLLNVFDGLVYALLTAGTFAALWP